MQNLVLKRSVQLIRVPLKYSLASSTVRAFSQTPRRDRYTMSGDKRKPSQRTQFDYMDVVSPGVTSLKIGAPSNSVLRKCSGIFRKAAMHRMDQADAHLLFQYGPEHGDRQFLETLAKFLTKEYQSPVNPDSLMVTAGATQGLNLLSHLLFSPDDLVFVENPTYFIAIRMLHNDSGMKFFPVAMDDQGLIPDELEKALEAHQSHKPRELSEKKPFWGMLYMIPTFHNPTGICLPPDRCRRVVELARKYNLLVVCDDVYNLLYFPQPDDSVPSYTRRLFDYDNQSDPDYQGNVVSNGSFSKIFGPGFRLGWMEAPQRVIDIITSSGMSQSGGGFNHTASGLMTSVISLGLLTDLLKDSRLLLQERCLAVCDTVRKVLPSASFQEPKGGYFMWIRLPNGVNAAELAKRCEDEAKITFFTGDLASPTGDFQDYMRISFSFYEKEVLIPSVEKVAKVFLNTKS